MNEEIVIKELEDALRGAIEALKNELRGIRSNRPSVDFLEDIMVSAYDQMMSIKQLGSLSVVPPREIQINLWDKTIVGAVMKAIESANVGLSVSNDGTIIRAVLPALSTERRAEFVKLAKKQAETIRIQIRNHRDDVIKKVKAAEAEKEITEDSVFKLKEKIQKTVDDANGQVEKNIEAKLKELEE